jgi:hypothetical protein
MQAGEFTPWAGMQKTTFATVTDLICVESACSSNQLTLVPGTLIAVSKSRSLHRRI